MKDYELIEHTADICIRVKAGDLKELFEKTALSMFDIIAAKDKESDGLKEIQIKLKADDLDELFVTWLNELLFLSATKELIFYDFNIEKLSKKELEAKIKGQGFENYKLNTEIKAATYHELEIKQLRGTWQAEVIFDV